MKVLLIALLSDAAHNQKVAATVSGWTIGTWAATILEWIPLHAGNIAVLFGAALSLVLIYTNIKQYPIKMRILKYELAERESRAGRRDRHDDDINEVVGD